MFPTRYFADRYFAPRYWAKSGSDVVEVDSPTVYATILGIEGYRAPMKGIAEYRAELIGIEGYRANLKESP